MSRLLRKAYVLRSSLFGHGVKTMGFRHGLLGTSQILSFSTRGKKGSKSDGSDSCEDNTSKKELTIQKTLDQITSAHGKGTIMWLGRSASEKHEPVAVVSTGSFALDMALGVGGLPKGRVVEVFGPEASGKTTLALHVIAEAQKQGGYCAFIDAEHSLDKKLAGAIGVNTQKLLLAQPECGELALSLVDTLIQSESLDVIVVDSVAALVPKGELDGEMGDAHMAMQARLMSQALRKFCHSLSKSNCILIFTNQEGTSDQELQRTYGILKSLLFGQNLNGEVKAFYFWGFGGPTDVTCGGNALKFYASVRLNIKRIGFVKKGEEAVGSQILVKVVKNKLAPPFKTAQFELEFGKGICREAEVIDLSLKHKFISKSGSFYNYNGKNFHGKDALKKFLASNPSVQEELILKLREKLLLSAEKEAEVTDEDEVVSPYSTDEEAAAIAAAEA